MAIQHWAARLWWTLVAAVALVVGLAGACKERRDPVVVRDGMLFLENQTDGEWRNVRVTINDHFTGGVATLLPGGVMTARLRDFKSGFGHPFEPARMAVQKVRVTATAADGKPVALAWPEKRGSP